MGTIKPILQSELEGVGGGWDRDDDDVTPESLKDRQIQFELNTMNAEMAQKVSDKYGPGGMNVEAKSEDFIKSLTKIDQKRNKKGQVLLEKAKFLLIED